jgi:DNA (cytosine-5)-methyltransferase 1
MNFLDLFSGIGGFPLAAYWSGLQAENHYFSEVDEYAISIYQRRFPDASALGDIKRIDYRSIPLGEWLVCGGFPCQPHSQAGKREGAADERDLWPECARMLRDLRPEVALFENVPWLFTSDGGRFFNRVLSDIAAAGYDAEWQIISALDVGAPHLRKRVWIVAYPNKRTVRNEPEPELRRQGSPESEYNGEQRALAYPQEQRRREGRTEPAGQCGELCATGSGAPLADSPRIQQGREIERPERERIGAGGESVVMADPNSHERLRRSRIMQMGWVGIAKKNEIDDDPRGTQWKFEPRVRRILNGVPLRVDRLKSLGNAIVPQVAEIIFNLPYFDKWRLTPCVRACNIKL